MITDLPRHILIDIFSKLPAKSIGKCRCLGKKWRTLLSSFQLIETHLNRQAGHQHLLVIESRSLRLITTNGTEAVSQELQFPNIWIEIVGSCDGLILLINEDNRKMLLNPITLEHVKIPNSPPGFTKGGIRMHGFGYDIFADDYKIVTLSYYNDISYGTSVDVYSVRRGVWKRVENSPYDPIDGLFCGAFVNGAIHWFAIGRKSGCKPVIVAFNLAHEVFDEIPAPSDVDVGNFVLNKLGVLGDRLFMIDTSSHNRADVWIMEKYGVKDSWTKFCIEVEYDLHLVKPLCCIGDEEVLFLIKRAHSIVYNRKAGTLRDMIVDGAPARFSAGCAFVESLMPSSRLC
ncbi:hypothetical protein CDL12_26047 [Handroanthus impetiginosus]|uniref:F-box domain-containing protein n=1 Tax=Handroanthus impetiginosus TaxID=429701 RepID=A0A2G9G829_9LAMI|nr:hypothetical protein CDL12_26047 [Handroanthus impetiginosus]